MRQIDHQIIAVPDCAIGTLILAIDPEIRSPAQIRSDRIDPAESETGIAVNLLLNHPLDAESGLIGVRFWAPGVHIVRITAIARGNESHFKIGKHCFEVANGHLQIILELFSVSRERPISGRGYQREFHPRNLHLVDRDALAIDKSGCHRLGGR